MDVLKDHTALRIANLTQEEGDAAPRTRDGRLQQPGIVEQPNGARRAAADTAHDHDVRMLQEPVDSLHLHLQIRNALPEKQGACGGGIWGGALLDTQGTGWENGQSEASL